MNETYRLTADDELAIARRMRQVADDQGMHRASNEARCGLMEQLIRVGLGAIACSTADLRDSELMWVEGQAEQVLGVEGWRSPCFDSPDWPRWSPPEVEPLIAALIHVWSGCGPDRCYACYVMTEPEAEFPHEPDSWDSRAMASERGASEAPVLVRLLVAALVLAAAGVWLAAPLVGRAAVERPCAVVAPSADAAGSPSIDGPMVGADYRSGRWWQGGSVVGWSSTEDGTVWNRQGCE
jgi:hypothetical protein